MADLGTFALLAALVVAAFGAIAGVLGMRRRDAALIESTRRAVVAWAALIALAAGVLIAALVTHQFSLRFVAFTTSRDLSMIYTLAAFWGGHAGSLLLWALILGGYGIAATRSLRAYPHLVPVVSVVLLCTALFFTATLAFASSPFEVLQVPPPDGRGLNPLLKNPWMAIHPPTLYLGFVGMTVPFALAVAALVTGRLDQVWVVLARRWVLTAWLFLTLGLLFGAKWSYVVLGWGGYWAWDPVENAALMPWLTATAFLHSVQVHERRGLLAVWTTALILGSFALSIFGTFLTRSGVLSSVHAFANSPVGIYFLGFLALVVVTSGGLLVWRRGQLRAEAQLESVVSRESAFLANNVVFLVAAFVILFGTIFPVLAEAMTGDQINVGPPYFNQVMIPIVVILLALMGVGPLLAWRRASPAAVGRTLAAPAALALLSALVLVVGGMRDPLPLLIFTMCGFVAATVLVEFRYGVRVRASHGEPVVVALARLVDRNRRRYGGYIVHLGMLLILVGITASSAFATQIQATLAKGERVQIGRFTVRYDRVDTYRLPGIRVTAATLSAFEGERNLGVLQARHLYHEVEGQPTTDIGLRSTWRDDLYVVLVAVAADGRATFRILINPLVMWLWAGGVVVAFGAVIALVPAKRRQERPVVERSISAAPSMIEGPIEGAGR